GDEIVLAHHAVSVLYEIYQQIEDLRLNRDQFATALELAAVGVKNVASEENEQNCAPCCSPRGTNKRIAWRENQAHPNGKSSFAQGLAVRREPSCHPFERRSLDRIRMEAPVQPRDTRPPAGNLDASLAIGHGGRVMSYLRDFSMRAFWA